MFSAAVKGSSGRSPPTWNKKSSGCGSRINIWFYLLCLFTGFSPLRMQARMSRRMFFLYNVPCPGAILCYALK